MIIEDFIHLPPSNGISGKKKENPSLQKAFRTPDEVICAICNPPPARLSPKKICDILKETKFTNESSLTKIISLATTSDLPEVPIGRYHLNSYTLALQDRPGTTDTNDPIATNPLGSYLTRVDIIDDNGKLDPRLCLIFSLGQLIKENAQDPDHAETGFYLVVNVTDSSIWIVYKFNQYTYMGQSCVVGENDRWGELAAGEDTPFSAAKIANSIYESGIGNPNSRIQIDSENTIPGGPRMLHFYDPDDQFHQMHLPRKYSMLLRG